MNVLPQFSGLTKRRLYYATMAIMLIMALGAVSIRFLEGLTWLDSFYFAAETITTVGYGDITPQTREGKIFTIFFMLVGVGTGLYALTVLAQSIIQSEVIEALGLRQKTTRMEKLKDHYIICGAGRVGGRVVHALEKEKISFVVIERDEKEALKLEDRGFHVLNADATIEENLINAGVKRAKGLAACLADDAANVYVILTARDLNADLHIVARAIEEQAETKLIRAGANRVIAPVIIGSHNMARALLKPAVADFMDSIISEELDLIFEEIAIRDDSPYLNKKIGATDINREHKILIVAIKRENGEMLFQPVADTPILPGDLLIVIGNAEKMKELVEELNK